MLSYDADYTMAIIYEIDYSRIAKNELVKYIAKQAGDQKYNVYKGVSITHQVIAKLKSIVKHK